MSISSSLQSIYDSKQAIKASLVNKGQEPTDVLSTYSSLIDSIETGGSQVKFTQGDFLYYYGFRAKDFPFNDLDTSEMVSMNNMFCNCNGVSTIDISEWNMTKVTDMNEMFKECNADYLVLGNLMPTALVNINGMFTRSKFKALDLHNLPIGNITSLSEFFFSCQELESINLTGWDTSNVNSMYGLFSNCSKLTSVDLTGWNTSNVTNIAYLFYKCSKLTSINLTGWDTSNLNSMYGLFSNCSELESADLSSFDTSNVTNIAYLFYNCSKLTSADLPSFYSSNLISISNLFYNCSELESVDLSSFNTSNVANISNLFSNCSKLTSVDLSSFDTSNVDNISNLFSNCSKLTSITGFSIDCVSDLALDASGSFTGCSSLTSLLFKPGGTMDGKSKNSSSFYLDLSGCTALTEASVVAMINSCSANTSGYVRGFKLASSVYDLLTEDDIALFTEKNYTVSK